MGLVNWVVNIFETIYREGEKEWLDEGKYKEMLSELYEELESGEIEEKDYEELELVIMHKLREIREYKREHEVEGD